MHSGIPLELRKKGYYLHTMKYLMNISPRNGVILSSVAGLITVAAMAALAQAPAFKPLTKQSKMAVNGIGPVRIGMPLTKAIDATQENWRVESALDESGCRYARPEKLGNSLSFMVVDGVVVRAEVSTRGISTLSGIRVGDTEAKVKATYPGKIKVEKHHYDEKGHYLIYTPSDPKDAQFRLVFETDGKVVTTYRSGRDPEVHWVEGCL